MEFEGNEPLLRRKGGALENLWSGKTRGDKRKGRRRRQEEAEAIV